MAVQTRAEIVATLVKSAENARIIRETAERLKGASQTAETETATTPVSLVKPTLSPFGQRQR